MCPEQSNLPFRAICLAGLLLCVSQSFAAGKDATTRATAEAQARYRQDIAACDSGQSTQDLNACRLEARNVLAQSRRGTQASAPGELASNARLRCKAHEGDARSACEARIRGEGTTSSGSVGGGGILRETVTVVPGG